MPREITWWVALGALGLMLQAADAAAGMPRWLLAAVVGIWITVCLGLVLRRRGW